MIPFEYLLYFNTVAHTLSINAAALKLDVTAPAISHGIKKLEEKLGLTLFTRSPQGVKLTKHGEIMLPLIEKVLFSVNQMESVAEELIVMDKAASLSEINSCVLFSEASIFDYYLSSISMRFYAKFPNIDLIIADKPLKDVLKTIDEDIFSFSILLVGSDVRQKIQSHYPNIAQLVVASHDIQLITKKKSKWVTPLLKTKTSVQLEDIVSLPHITTSWNSSANYTTMRLLKSCGTPNIVTIAPNISALRAFIENDVGVVLGIEKAYKLATINNTECIPLEINPSITLDYTFFYNKELSPVLIDAFSKIIKDSFNEKT